MSYKFGHPKIDICSLITERCLKDVGGTAVVSPVRQIVSGLILLRPGRFIKRRDNSKNNLGLSQEKGAMKTNGAVCGFRRFFLL